MTVSLPVALMTRVLIVEDEPQLLEPSAINLRARQLRRDTAARRGVRAQARPASTPPDLVILDLGLPDMDGVEVIHGLRGWTQAPIIMLSARERSGGQGRRPRRRRGRLRDEALRHGRAAGPGPRRPPPGHSPARTRRSSSPPPSPSTWPPSGSPGTPRDVRLTPTEWHLLEILVRHAGQARRQEPAAQRGVGPRPTRRETNYLRVYMAQLRRKLEPDPSHPRHLITEPGMGYRFEP